MSRTLALQSANDVKRAKGWNNVSLTARKVKGDPFWKAVRSDGVMSNRRTLWLATVNLTRQ